MTERMLSHYRMLRRLGAGGMGEVYLAEDTRLQRQVALKLLPPEAAGDPDRMARFRQEALATSALNHPNITTIYEIGTEDGQAFMAIEYIPGQTLRALQRAGDLDLDRLLDIAVQVSEGLAAAHEAGVVHRDLKPENIMVRPDGIVKILDFGLAKLQREPELPDPESDETVVSPGAEGSLTVPGVVLGTIGYMSPEQARGAEVDARSDVFAFGSILYELVSGQRPWRGDSSLDVLSSILRDPPPPLEQPAIDEVPAELERILRKCLAKKPEERYQTARDLVIDLRALQRERQGEAVLSSRSGIRAVEVPREQAPGRGRRLGALIGVGVAVVLALAAWWWSTREPGARRGGAPLRIDRVTNTGTADGPALSPDGQYLAYLDETDGRESIHLRQLATRSDVEVVPAQPDIDLAHLRFSPDGNWLLYTTRPRQQPRRTLWQVPPLGGAPRRVLEDVDSEPSFAPEGDRFVFHRGVGRGDVRFFVATFSSDAPAREVRRAPEDALVIINPVWSPRPGSDEIAWVEIPRDDVAHPRLRVGPLEGDPGRVVSPPGWMQILGYDWARDGDALYVCASGSWIESPQIWRVPRDGGTPQRITNDLDSYSSVAVSGTGDRMAAVRTTVSSQFWRMPVGDDPAANAAAARRLTRGTEVIGAPDVSPDGRRIAYGSGASGHLNIWVMDVDGSNRRQLTFGDSHDFQPLWSPDGRWIAYGSERGGDMQIWIMDAEGGQARPVAHGGLHYGHTWSPDSRSLAYLKQVGTTSELYRVGIDGGEPRRIATDVGMVARWSPDGRVLATWQMPRDVHQLLRLAIVPADPEAGDRRVLDFVSTDRFQMVGLRWTPDGRGLSMPHTEAGRRNLVRVDAETGEMRKLSAFDDEQLVFWHTWMPAGDGVVLQRGELLSDIVLLTNLP